MKQYVTFLLLGVVILVSFFVLATRTSLTFSEEDSLAGKMYEARIIAIVSQQEVPRGVNNQLVQEQRVVVELIQHGQRKETTIVNDMTPLAVGDRIYVQEAFFDEGVNEETSDAPLTIIGINRVSSLLLLLVIFIASVLLVSGMHGFRALVALLFSIAVIFAFIIPWIVGGNNAIVVALLGSGMIVVGTLWISYGFNKKSLSALLGILLSLTFVGVATWLAIGLLHFTGYSGEESTYLMFQTEQQFNLLDLLIAGIIIAALGVLDDVAVTQASSVFALASSNHALRGLDLFKKGMSIGKDHLSAVINTLFLAYAGASLPLLLLITLGKFPLGFTLSNELIAHEIARTLLASLGLILVIPFTTAIAVFFIEKKLFSS